MKDGVSFINPLLRNPDALPHGRTTVYRSSQERDFAIHDAGEVAAVAHDPRDAAPRARQLGPLARLLRVLFDEDAVVREFDVAQAGLPEASDAAAAREELLEGDEDDARRRYVRRFRSVGFCHLGK